MITSKLLRKFVLVIGMIAVAYSGFSATRTYPVSPCSGKINIDGKLNDPDWKHAPWAGDFLPLMISRDKPVTATQFKMLYDEKNLYIGVKAFEKFPDRLKMLKSDGEAVWQDDAIEIYLQPHKTAIHRREAVNAGGKVSNKKMHAASTIYPEGYVIEVAIPYEVFGRHSPSDGGNIIRGNIARACQTGSGSRFSCWATCNNVFKERSNFAAFLLLNKPVPEEEINNIEKFINIIIAPLFLNNANLSLNLYRKLLEKAKINCTLNKEQKIVLDNWRKKYQMADDYIKVASLLAGKKTDPGFWIAKPDKFISTLTQPLNPLLFLLKPKLADQENDVKYFFLLEEIVK